MINISKEDLSEEEFEAVVSSRGFQKMLVYQRLVDGIEALQTHDRLYESMVQRITEQHSEIDSVDSTEEVLSLFADEVVTYTAPLAVDNEDDSLLLKPMSAFDDTLGTPTGKNDPKEVVREYLDDRLEESDEIEVKASDIAPDIGIRSPHVGRILGRWKRSEHPPFAISASGSDTGGKVWTIKQTV